MGLRHRSGVLLQATAIGHNLLGVILFWRPLQAMLSAGMFNSVVPHPERAAVFWFLLFGALLWVLGTLTNWAERMYHDLPRSLGWGLLAIALMGILALPVSGFWLVLPQAYLVLRASKAALPVG